VITIDFQRLDISPGDRLLDIGCGEGRHTCGAAAFKDVMAVGADINFKDVCKAREKLRLHEALGEVRGKWRVLVSDIHRLPYSDSVFDAVVCSEVLEHLPDHGSAISEIIRVLKPGKNLVVTVPRYLPERICWYLSKSYHTEKNGHVRIYRQRRLIDLIERSGVRHWSSHWAHSLHTPYWWLKCLAGPAREDSVPVNLYHRFLVWDMMKGHGLVRFAEKLFDPLLGKSLVLYFRK
jgi:SAM-dependent methyltransferase